MPRLARLSWPLMVARASSSLPTRSTTCVSPWLPVPLAPLVPITTLSMPRSTACASTSVAVPSSVCASRRACGTSAFGLRCPTGFHDPVAMDALTCASTSRASAASLGAPTERIPSPKALAMPSPALRASPTAAADASASLDALDMTSGLSDSIPSA